MATYQSKREYVYGTGRRKASVARVHLFQGGSGKIVINGRDIQIAAKTGTAEYCDNVAQSRNLCVPGNWPSHAWVLAYGPYEDPEIAISVFVYNGQEGASVAGPIARKILEAYFELKAIDSGEPEFTEETTVVE